MSETLIKVEGLSKKFCSSLKRSMLYGTTDVMRDMVGFPYKADKLRKKEFWALQDINFELKRGECLGLIGKNGCGKSTLLRLINGIFPPDKGRIEFKGRMGGLIAVGAGFHPYMTGRENIYLNGIILGMSKQEIKKKFDEIVDFAEIGEFIDAPVATYSSGMKVRLGFAIATEIQPDILLIDEVLAVGDMGFVIKCLNKINKIIENSAVIFVSHSMQFVSRIATEIMVLDSGKVVKKTNDIPIGIDFYNNLFPTSCSKKSGSLVVDITDVTIVNHTQKKTGNEVDVRLDDEYSIIFNLKFLKKIKNTNIGIIIGKEGVRESIGIYNDNKTFNIAYTDKKIKVETRLKSRFNFGKNVVAIIAGSLDTGEIYNRFDNAAIINANYQITSWADTLINGNWSVNEI